MQTGYYGATGGMVTQFNRLDVISHNLANLNTNGYKRDDVVIGDFMRLWQGHQDTLPIPDDTQAAARFINRTMTRVPTIAESYTDHSVGSMDFTENELDFALKSPNMFFAVQTPNGIAYTRNGSFSISDDGYLVTKEGFHVLSRDGIDNEGGIMMNSNMQIAVDKNGNIGFKDLTNEGIQGNIAGGSLAIVTFDNPKFLKKIGSSLYIEDRKVPNDTTSEGLAGANLVYNSGAVEQGFLEKSNVNAVLEMSSMIETNRLVDMYSKVMKTHMDELNSEAINKLAVRA
ncbi:flagellar hook-basal body complex protein [Helicobacter saguini]|uniref:Flagellar hook-basal body complex protein n=1 Tax=Helicobacter saguini TaxID=1548018 RepID=A0A347VS26_9HELI|nr:flagellar hook-basal body protein [Helicobacter saguini]MWV62678.1 flagellar hook-basal body complex protein [Helicobacter saguini]MWV66650.1 flagellar hook-basal body complex protein [Helicobacter saguini]MWV69000.1 flagellar hook-basal body complex protein [Helicobacter saguini]MWV71446.1 flagellar hook-basal body complex protein [Helicobacter saguini]TLD94095.1 flagellar hook-basal body protein [Helicobacter saguini]